VTRLQIKEIAQGKGMNITDVQLKANKITDARLTYATVHALWHNKTRRPDLDTLAAVARALDVAPGDLIVVEELPANKRMPALTLA